MIEVWKDIEESTGYQVSNFGNIKSLKRDNPIILKPFLRCKRYLGVKLSHNGKEQRVYIHRLVAKYFLPNPENKKQIHHIDGNLRNNRVDNLKWVSQSEITSKWRRIIKERNWLDSLDVLK